MGMSRNMESSGVGNLHYWLIRQLFKLAVGFCLFVRETAGQKNKSQYEKLLTVAFDSHLKGNFSANIKVICQTLLLSV